MKSKAEKLIRNIESMQFGFPAPSIGYGVDRVTGEGEPPEEEGIDFQIQIRGERGLRVITGSEAHKIYEIVLHFLDDESPVNPA